MIFGLRVQARDHRMCSRTYINKAIAWSELAVGPGVLILLLILQGCRDNSVETTQSSSPSVEDDSISYQQKEGELHQTIRRIADNDEVVQEFVNLFPDARHFIYGFVNDKPQWRSESLIYGRYVVVLSMMLERAADDHTLTSQGQPEYRLIEVSSAERLKDGRIELRYGPLNNRMISKTEWKQLVKSDGDFQSIGILLVADEPIKLFEEHYHSLDIGGY